jgi:hypothetical protein
MEKRRAITLAGVMSMTGAAALAAIFTNFGILGASEADDVGRLNAGTIVSESPVPTTAATASDPEVQVIYEDVPAAVTGTASDDHDDDAEHDDDELYGSTTVVTVDDDHDDDAVEHVEDDDHDEDGPEVDEDGPEVDEDGPEGDDHGEFDDD